MSAREDILSAIRTALGPDAPGRDPEAVDARLARHQAGLQPARAQSEGEDRVAQFIEWAEFVATTVDRVAGLDDVPGAVTRYLSANNLPAKARRATNRTEEHTSALQSHLNHVCRLLPEKKKQN